MTNISNRAWTYEAPRAGFIDNIRLTTYNVPDLAPDHVLIEVLNVSLNPGDLKFPLLPIFSWRIKCPPSVCHDFCGRIRALPAGSVNLSSGLHVGQTVFGCHLDVKNLGTLKTIISVHKDSLYPLPENVPVAHGSGYGIAAISAYQAIAPHAKPQAKVLINGGTGGLGTFGIQIAKALGMYVIATCSDSGAQLCRDLGADEIIDYKSPRFYEELSQTQVDLAIDNVGSDPSFHARSEVFLKPDGQFVLVALMDYSWAGIYSMLVSLLLPSWLGGPPRRWRVVFMSNKTSDYASVAALAEESKLKVVVDSTYAFEDAPQAYERLRSGRTKGKIIVAVNT